MLIFKIKLTNNYIDSPYPLLSGEHSAFTLKSVAASGTQHAAESGPRSIITEVMGYS